ncbi:MAG: PD40 domain-containing protein, partial [Anaerohalosphaera sp.]|nr:PD40 domain-containing protein [Anaerohalosphaera sp.]
MKIKYVSKIVFIVLAALLCSPLIQAEILFQIGKPDGSTQGYALAETSYKNYSFRFTAPIVFTVGKNSPNQWPFIHPSTLDLWAGSKAHTCTINFTIDQLPQKELYLHIGFVDTWRYADLEVALNENSLGKQEVPKGSGRDTLAFEPLSEGKPSSLTFKVPAAKLKSGSNKLTLTLDNGSWIVYDHITLDDSKAAPHLAPRPPVTISAKYLDGKIFGFDEIVFAARPVGSDGHWYANFSYYAQDENRKAYRQSAKLCKMNIRTGATTILLEDPKGSIRDPQVHYDGKKIIFAYRKGGTDNFNLYEIDTDGNNLTQITRGQYDDFEPAYLPDDTIIFISSRCKRWVNCWLTQVAVLYRCDADGSNIRQLSANNEHENTPWPLPDGRILYQRWEYVDRSQVHYHHLWTTNPDGTNQSVFYGNMRPGVVMIDAKPIPGSNNILTVFSWGHGAKEHAGDIAILTPKSGPDHEQSAKVISKGGNFRDPYPIADNFFLVARGPDLFIMEADGKLERIYRLGKEFESPRCELHEPRPIVARKRELTIPSRIDETKAVGSLILVDVYKGRNMEGVKKGGIKELLVLETLPKPINYTGGMDPLTYGGSFTLERVLGTVPVEDDGSAYMELPADRGLFFVALDESGKSVKRMQSFLTVKPGETTSCLGCHEQRTSSGTNINTSALIALKR